MYYEDNRNRRFANGAHEQHHINQYGETQNIKITWKTTAPLCRVHKIEPSASAASAAERRLAGAADGLSPTGLLRSFVFRRVTCSFGDIWPLGSFRRCRVSSSSSIRRAAFNAGITHSAIVTSGFERNAHLQQEQHTQCHITKARQLPHNYTEETEPC